MADESFDLEELENLTSQPTVTAWSSQLNSRSRGTRTYGRNGSVGVHPRRFKATREEEPLEESLQDKLSPSMLAEEEFGFISDFDERSIPVFKPTIPKVPGRKRFSRAHSMSDVAPYGSNKDPILKRSVSVSDSYASSTMSTRSSSVSSGLASIASSGIENLHPNEVDPLEALVAPKRSARPQLELRGRKKSRSMSVGHASLSLSSSFSNLAQEESSSMWSKASPPSKEEAHTAQFSQSVPDFRDLEFLESSSPDLSSPGSHRKRRVCESPFENFDDHYSVNMSTTKRSSLFSPPTYHLAKFHLESMAPLNDSNHEGIYSKKSKLMDIASDDGSAAESGIDTNDLDSDDESLGGDLNRLSPVPTFVPFDQRQKRRSSTPVFPDTVVCKTYLDPSTSTVDDVIDSMSSYHDMKYLAKRLRQQREGSICWHVALPSAWGEAQRRSFIHWITGSLGFTHRKAGAQAAYFQIPKSRGIGILNLLQASIAACQERGIGGKSPLNAGCTTPTFFGTSMLTRTQVG